GYSGGMNLGLEELRRRGAALLLALNADVVLASEALGRLAAALAADPAAGVAGPLVLARKVPDRVGSAGMTYREGSGRVRQRAHGKRGSEVDDRTERVAGVEGSA